jgi:hypothetical protein
VTIDFHSLRVTAMIWWLNEYRLPLRMVQQLSGVRTPQLLERFCVRRFAALDFSWLDQCPKLV